MWIDLFSILDVYCVLKAFRLINDVCYSHMNGTICHTNCSLLNLNRHLFDARCCCYCCCCILLLLLLLSPLLLLSHGHQCVGFFSVVFRSHTNKIPAKQKNGSRLGTDNKSLGQPWLNVSPTCLMHLVVSSLSNISTRRDDSNDKNIWGIIIY